MLCRKFSYLQSRLLLYKQDVLGELGRDLDDVDRADAKKSLILLASRERDDARSSGDRKKLIVKISQNFHTTVILDFFFRWFRFSLGT
jgi:hypothetical protein